MWSLHLHLSGQLTWQLRRAVMKGCSREGCARSPGPRPGPGSRGRARSPGAHGGVPRNGFAHLMARFSIAVPARGKRAAPAMLPDARDGVPTLSTAVRPERGHTRNGHTAEAIVIALVLALFSAVVNHDLLHAVMRKLRIIKKTSHSSERYSAFARNEVGYVVLHLKDERRVQGWPHECQISSTRAISGSRSPNGWMPERQRESPPSGS